MSRPKITYVEKKKIEPYFGYAWPGLNEVWIRKDLPWKVQLFVLSHELYHLQDGAKSVFWREVRANIHGAIRHPLGAFIAVLMTISSFKRWKAYYWRFKEGK